MPLFWETPANRARHYAAVADTIVLRDIAPSPQLPHIDCTDLDLSHNPGRRLACGLCADRAAAVQDYVDAMGVAALEFFDPYEGRH